MITKITTQFLSKTDKPTGEWPENLLQTIKESISKQIPTPSQQLFKFEISKESANYNWKILSQFKNLGEALDKQKSSSLGYGSEFRPSSTLGKFSNTIHFGVDSKGS